MIFDGKQTEFPSEIHEHIWALGKRIVPFEISTAGFTDKEMLEGFRQIYDFTVELFTDMYKDPDKYKISFGKKIILENHSFVVCEGSRYALFIHHYLGGFAFHLGKNKKIMLANNNWIIKPEYMYEDWEKDFFEIFELIEPIGIFYENNSDGTITLKSSRYPLFFKYLIMFVEAGAKRKMGVSDYVNSCDFRVLNKQRKTTIDDMVRNLSESNKALVLELHNHLISKGIKRKLRGNNCHDYSCKNENVLRIQNDPREHNSMYLDFRVSIGNSQNDEKFKFMLSEIETLPDKDNLLKYISDNINCCTLCGGHRVQQCGGNKWEEFLGEQKLFCWAFGLSIRRNSIRGIYDNEHDIKMLKQILDLRIKAIESLTL